MWIRLEGRLDEEAADEVMHRVWEHADGTDDELRVLVDLRDLDDCAILARAKLINLQTRLAGPKSRTAWLSTRPRFRGLALLICHGSDDPHAKVVSSEKQARDWLDSDEARLDVAKSITERLKRLNTRGQRQ